MNQAVPLAPARHKLDVAAFYRMAEVGIIGARDRIELIDGDLIDMAPIGDDHVAAVDLLTERLVLATHGRATTSVQNPLRLDQQTQPQPDLTLYRRSDRSGAQRGPADVLLVVEVADSSLDYDSSVKGGLYSRFEIPEYWIVDVKSHTIVIHRQASMAGYKDVQTVRSGTPVSLAAAPDIVIDLTGLFI